MCRVDRQICKTDLLNGFIKPVVSFQFSVLSRETSINRRMVMDFMAKFLQGIAFVPAIVNGIETLFGGRSGAEKKDAAMSFVTAALQLSDAVTARHIVDEDKFKQGLSSLIDGVVLCLNSSTWSKSIQL